MKVALVFEAIDRASKVVGKLTSGMDRLSKATGRVAAFGAKVVSAGLVAGFTAATAALATSTTQAIAFESAMADVNKVVGFETPAQLGAFSDQILDMSTRLPVAAAGLAEISASAAQAGIALEDNLDFTQLTAKAVVAFDMTAGQAGEMFAKISNNFSLSNDALTAFADSANHLSNSMAASAPQILDFVKRASGAAPMLKLTSVELGALGTSLIATGTSAETAARGVTALGTRLVADKTKASSALKSIGLSYKSFMQELERSPATAFEELFRAVQKSGNGIEALKTLVGQDFVDDFSKLAAQPQLLAQAFELVAEKASYAGSVQSEFEARAATTEANLQRTKNTLAAIATEIGSTVLPMINQGLDAFRGWLDTIRNNMAPIKATFEDVAQFWSDLGSGFGSWADAIGASFQGAGEALSRLGTSISELMSTFTGSDAVSSFGTALGNLAGGGIKLLADAIKPIADFFTATIQSIQNWSSSISAAFSGAKDAFGDLGETIGRIFNLLGGESSDFASLVGEGIGLALTVLGQGAEIAATALNGVLSGVEGLIMAIQGQDVDWSGLIPEFELPDLPTAWAEGFVALLGSITDAAKGVVTAITSGIGGAIEGAKSALSAVNPANWNIFGGSNETQIEAATPKLPEPATIERLEGLIAGVSKGAAKIPSVVQNAASQAKAILSQANFHAQGVAMMDTLAAGIRARASVVTAEIRAVTQAVRDHLPSSPAKVGPLSDIHKLKFAETIASSIRPAPMIKAMRGAAAAAVAAAAISAPSFASGSFPATAPVAPKAITRLSIDGSHSHHQEASAKKPSIHAPSSQPARGGSGGSGGPVSVTFHLNYQGGGNAADDKKLAAEMAHEVTEIVARELERRERRRH